MNTERAAKILVWALICAIGLPGMMADAVCAESGSASAECVAAFAFGSRSLSCPTFTNAAVNYTMVIHGAPAELQYDPARGWGYELLYPTDSPYGDRAGYGVFGPFDDSPNDRNKFSDECPEELYDSFIGCKDFTEECSEATIGDPDMPCAPVIAAEGVIFRIDVPNGLYRFVGAFGDADNVHAHRILAEDGGQGPPENIGANHVVLVSNFDQAQQTIGEADEIELGEGVYARVGFDGKIPPPGDGVFPSPQFVDMDENGRATEGPANSPVLEVTQGYIRIHQLQGNSNDGPGGPRDGNGGDIVILELWKVGAGEPVCTEKPIGTDVGEALPGGSIGWEGFFPDYLVTAGGADIWGTTDQFYYACCPSAASGDFTAIVGVRSIEPNEVAHEWAKAGIMARQNLEPGSPHIMVLRSLKNGAVLQGRSQPNEQSWSIHMDGDYGPEDTVWLRLDRIGNTFIGSYFVGVDGAAPTKWTASSSHEIVLPPDVHLGLATTSHQQGTPVTVEYIGLWVGPYAGPPVLEQPDLPSDSPLGGVGYIGIREVIDNGEIPDQDACYASLASGNGTIFDYQVPVLNIHDSGGNGRSGNDDVFGVVMAGHREQGSVDNISLIARGTIRIPADQGGFWTFGVNSDDGFTLQLPGQNFISAVNGEIVNFERGAALRFYGGRGVADTLGLIELLPGDHPFWLTYHEGGGDAAVEFFAAKGVHTNFDPDVFRPVGHESVGLISVPGLVDEVAITVSRPGAWSGGQIANLGHARAALTEGEANGTNSHVMSLLVNHSDAEDGAADPDQSGSFPGDLAFPGNTDGDDDDFAVMVRGLLEIPADGVYHIGFNSDDGASLQIFGQTWRSIVADATGNAVIDDDLLINDSLTGWSYTLGQIYLAAGHYEFEAVMFERGGGAFFELLAETVVSEPGSGSFSKPLAADLYVLSETLLKVGRAELLPDLDGLSLVAKECIAEWHPARADWVALGKPYCWCWPYQCEGDADSVTSGFPFNYRVHTGDLKVLIQNWRKKLGDPSLDPCADIDHKDSGFPSHYRVYVNDLAKIVANWQKTDAQLSDNCPRMEMQVAAKFLTDNSDLKCQPICMDTADMNRPGLGVIGAADPTSPVSFEVCSSATGCFQLEAGQTVNVSADATIRAPDGTTKGQQLPCFEQDAPLRFHKWSDGVTANPRPLFAAGIKPKGNPLLEFVAIYHLATLSCPSPKEACQAGCPSSDVELFLTNKQWVEKQGGLHVVEGPVTHSHMSHEDFFGTHYTEDYIIWVLLSGEEVQKKLSKKDGQYGDRPHQIQVEWETGSYPGWARPWGETKELDEPDPPKIEDADHVWILGKLIFDCGHSDDAIEQGAWTEIHPPIAVATMRGTQQGKKFLRDELENHMTLRPGVKLLHGVKVDVWINGDGGRATEIVSGVNAHDIRRIYKFKVPLPPPPPPPSTPHVQSQFVHKPLRLQQGQPEPTIAISKTAIPGGEPTELEVTIDLTNYQDTWGIAAQEGLSNHRGDAYGVTIIAGWEEFDYPPDLHRIRLDATDIRVFDDWEGEDGDGEFKLTLEIGPGAAIGGDVLEQETSVALHDLNTDLNDAAGHGEAYPLRQDGKSLIFTFNVRDNALATENNHLSFSLEGFEHDPIWDDALPTLERAFYPGHSLFNGLPPVSAGCGILGSPTCEYGNEVFFGTIRGMTTSPPPIDYEDGVSDTDSRCIGDWIISFLYKIEEINLVP